MKPAALFTSDYYRAEDWLPALARRLPELEVRVWPDIGAADEIDIALVHNPPPGFFASLPGLRAIIAITAGVENLLDVVRDLAGKPLLNLGAVGKEVDQPGELAQSNHPVTGDVGDIGPADERHEVVLAHRLEGNVADDDHFVVRLLEGGGEDGGGILVDTGENFGVHASDPVGGVA